MRIQIIDEETLIPKKNVHLNKFQLWYLKSFSIIMSIATAFFISNIVAFIMWSDKIAEIRSEVDSELELLHITKEEYHQLTSTAELDYLIGKTFIEPMKFSEDNLVDFVNSLPFKYPKVVIAQVTLESSMGKSNLAKTNKNLIGMKHPRSRNTVSIKPDANGYAVYINWQHCIIDRLLWERVVISDEHTLSGYLNKLGKIYAEDPGYINKLKKLL